MTNKLFQLKSYLHYLMKRKGKHQVHSPFVYDFLTKALSLQTAETDEDFKLMQQVRKRSFTNKNVIETVDFGAASGRKKFTTYRIATNKLAKQRSNPPYINHVLYKVVKHFKPETMIELGTSVGLGSMALALGKPSARLITLEGCASVASVAESNLKKFNLNHIELVIGSFENTLQTVLDQIDKVDLVFFDGNHRKQPTLRYFKQCLAKAHEESVFIFDDIHWSGEMETAWEQIKEHKKVSLTMDFYHLGLVFFREGMNKQDFVLKLYK